MALPDRSIFLRGINQEVTGKKTACAPALMAGGGDIPLTYRGTSRQVFLRKGGPEGKNVGKLSFIDLAGSERASDTGKNTDRTRRLEVRARAEWKRVTMVYLRILVSLVTDNSERASSALAAPLPESIKNCFLEAEARIWP